MLPDNISWRLRCELHNAREVDAALRVDVNVRTSHDLSSRFCRQNKWNTNYIRFIARPKRVQKICEKMMCRGMSMRAGESINLCWLPDTGVYGRRHHGSVKNNVQNKLVHRKNTFPTW